MTMQLSPSHIGLPPPVRWDLIDADRLVGQATDRTVTFYGFADGTEAAHAAWVAYRALARRLAQSSGTRPIPIHAETVSIHRDGDRDMILAGQRPIATLVRHDDSPADAPAFGFVIQLPQPTAELRVRALAYLMYRALRKSGVRWALWRPAGRAPVSSAAPAKRPRVATPASRATNGLRASIARIARRFTVRTRRLTMSNSAWAVLTVTSFLLVLSALFVGDGLGTVLVVTGLAGLITARIAARTGRWGSSARAPVSRRRGAFHEVDLEDDYRNAGSCA